MRTRTAVIASAAALAITAAGCGSSSGGTSATPASPTAPEVSPAGDIPDNQAYVPFAPPGGGFRIKVPEGWSRSSAGGTVTFTDKLNSIRIETAAAPRPMTVREATQAEVPRLAASVRGYRPGAVTAATRPAGVAVRITYLADAKPNPVTGKAGQDAVERYVFFHRGKDIILTLAGPKGADNVDPWKLVTGSLAWTP